MQSLAGKNKKKTMNRRELQKANFLSLYKQLQHHNDLIVNWQQQLFGSFLSASLQSSNQCQNVVNFNSVGLDNGLVVKRSITLSGVANIIQKRTRIPHGNDKYIDLKHKHCYHKHRKPTNQRVGHTWHQQMSVCNNLLIQSLKANEGRLHQMQLEQIYDLCFWHVSKLQTISDILTLKETLKGH